MTDLNLPKVPKPDTLRDRIAAVWLQHDGAYCQYKPGTDLTLITCDCGWIGETDEYQEYAHHFADEMIEALGMTVEHEGPPIVPPCHRYVTEWENDE